MKASDTVMTNEQIKESIIYMSQPYGHIAVLKQVAKEQAEVSFKAGIKEVVDFIGQPFEHNYFRHGLIEEHDINDCFACKFEAKVKEWGIECEKVV